MTERRPCGACDGIGWRPEHLAGDLELAEARLRGYLDALIGNGCGATTPTLRVLRASLGPAGGSEETLDPQARHDLLWEIARAAADAGYYEDDPPRDGR